MFLIEKDYRHLIRGEVLDIVQNDEATRQDAERSAIEEIKSYLKTQFETDLIFISHTIWSPAVEYNFNDFVLLTATTWNATAIYSANDLVEFNGTIYQANATTVAGESPDTTPAKWDAIDLDCTFYTALKTQRFEKGVIYEVGEFVFQDSKRYEVIQKTNGEVSPKTDTNNEFYTLNTDTVTAGTALSDTNNWTKGDTRSPLVLRHTIDITLYELHARINPRNIPEFRINKRDDAIDYLKRAASPRNNMQPDLPLRQFEDQQGTDMSWNTNRKQNHGQNTY